ncbi:FAD-dependent monooxygenase [Streptomyces sp. NBC_00101]|uniref:FAD-dependent monooxygenase n=1 Tax=Streptomyces sp. NBC_00101 TaxID=2975651 RepID=UPI00324DFE4C
MTADSTDFPARPQVQVLVVGGGPVGMLIAAELSHYGVRVAVVEQNPVTLDIPKAGTLHARTAQTLRRRGYLPGPGAASALLSEERAQGFHFAGLPGLTITAPAVEGEPIVGRAQSDLERQFEFLAGRRGAAVLRGYRAIHLRTDDEGAVLTVREDGSGRESELAAQWVIGADGARSSVRALAGIGSEEHLPTTRAVLGLVTLDDPARVPPGWTPTARGWTVIGPNPFGPSRVAAFDFSGPQEDRRTPLTLEELRRTVSHIAGFDIPMSAPRYLDRFSDYSRLAHTYRKGRVLLAGDAAHVHFPVGGQGLNLGLQDAVNLSWKLAHHLKGWPSPTLLDSYTAERRPPAARTIDNTRAQLALMQPGGQHDALRALFTDLLRNPAVSRQLGDMISDQDVTLPRDPDGHPWTGMFLPNFPLRTARGETCVADLLHSGRLQLIILSGETETALRKAAGPWDEVLDVVTAPAGAIGRLTAVLVRPDGYIAWADEGDGSDDGAPALEAALDALLGRRDPSATPFIPGDSP